MTDPWKALHWRAFVDAGAPDGTFLARRSGPLEEERLGTALATIELKTLNVVDREILLAFLAAFAQHWPVRFAGVAGERGQLLLTQLGEEHFDANRILKLRRIALENLAGRI